MEQLSSFITFVGFFLSVLSGLTCIALARKLREVTHKQHVMATDADYRFSEVRQNIDAIANQTTAQLQRFSQTISQPRVQPQPQPQPAMQAVGQAVAQAVMPLQPQPQPQPQPVAIDPVIAGAVNSRQSVTERRHRVLTLARRGMDVKAIAQTLGIPHGEVALIIRMSNPKFGE